MKKTLLGFLDDHLFRNSFYLMLSTGVVAFFGFLFWLVASQFFSPLHVGIATTLIAVMNMIALLSLVGFDTVFIRFLPGTEEKNNTINTGFLTVGIAAILISSGFLLLVDKISPTLGFINNNVWISLAFIAFSTMSTCTTLNEAIFLANRKTKYTLITNTVFNALRLFLLFFLVRFGFLGIFFAVVIAQFAGLILSLFLLSKTGYTFAPKIDFGVLRKVRSYSGWNYLAGILNLLPATVLPITITNNLGPEKAAFYGIAMMVGNLLYTIPWVITRSLFAEGSHNPDALRKNAGKAFKMISLFMIPAILLICVFGEYFLSFFGKQYSLEGFRFLQIIAVAGIAVSTLSVLETFFRVMSNANWLIAINALFLATVWIGSHVFLSYGLVGIGIAWLLAHVIASIASYIILQTRNTVSL